MTKYTDSHCRKNPHLKSKQDERIEKREKMRDTDYRKSLKTLRDKKERD
jgi:hypothetical protein